jgi:hypothetical protein
VLEQKGEVITRRRWEGATSIPIHELGRCITFKQWREVRRKAFSKAVIAKSHLHLSRHVIRSMIKLSINLWCVIDRMDDSLDEPNDVHTIRKRVIKMNTKRNPPIGSVQ